VIDYSKGLHVSPGIDRVNQALGARLSAGDTHHRHASRRQIDNRRCDRN
jgi:hypothetical protein